MTDIQEIQSRLRIQSIEHSSTIAKARKEIQSILDYELALVIDMLSDGQPSERILKHVTTIADKLSAMKQFGGLHHD